MPSALFVSPHLDDVAFSCAGTLVRLVAAGWQATVVTVFTATVPSPTGFALACQLDKGLGPEVDYLALRRSEDRRFAARVGASTVHLPFAEAPHRGYASAPALFAGVRPDARAALAPALAAALGPLAHLADVVFVPQGLGHHVDHRLVSDAASAAPWSERCVFYRDTPYAMRLAALAPDGLPPDVAPLGVELGAALAVKQLGCASYRTQLGFQFGGPGAMNAALAAFHLAEGRRGGLAGAAELLWARPAAAAVLGPAFR